jgi:tRNA1(Val) A37 N6-methylase TrmN6
MTDYIPNSTLKLIQDEDDFKMTSDSIHLAQFMAVRKNDRVLDVGCNSGVLSLVAATKTKSEVIGIDINEAAIELAISNAKLNALNNLSFIPTSLQKYESLAFDLMVCNPPYYKNDQTFSAKQAQARFEIDLSLKDLAIHSNRLLKDKGRLVIIIPVERFHDWLILAHQTHLTVKRCAFIHHSQDHPAKTVLVEAVKNGKGTMRVEAPIFNR